MAAITKRTTKQAPAAPAAVVVTRPLVTRLTPKALQERAILMREMANYFFALDELLEHGQDWPLNVQQHCHAWAALMRLDLAS